jgi:chromate transporter
MYKKFEMFLFIIKITFLGFGGGNAMKSIIHREAVVKKK